MVKSTVAEARSSEVQLAPEIWHLLTLCALINFTCLLTLSSREQRLSVRWCVFVAGITLNWGVMIAWSAIHGSLTTPGLVLYTSCVLWTMIYDTIYSHQV